MPKAAKVIGIVGHIWLYYPKSMEWSMYKGRFTFYFQANNITDAAFKRATVLILIGDTAYRLLADLHLSKKTFYSQFRRSHHKLRLCLRLESFKTCITCTVSGYRPARGTVNRRVVRRTSSFFNRLRFRRPTR